MTDTGNVVLEMNQLLHEGFGVEDIALRLKIEAARVRRHVVILRRFGRLRNVLRTGKP